MHSTISLFVDSGDFTHTELCCCIMHSTVLFLDNHGDFTDTDGTIVKGHLILPRWYT
jgi:hypothetical protein